MNHRVALLSVSAILLGILSGGAFPPAAADDGCVGSATVSVAVLPLVLDLDTTDAGDDATGLCAVAGGAPDLVYSLVLEAFARLEIEAVPAPGFDAMLYLRSGDCDDPLAELACADAGGDGQPERLLLDLPPGSHYLFVDGHVPADHGPLVLSISGVLPVESSTWGRIKHACGDGAGAAPAARP